MAKGTKQTSVAPTTATSCQLTGSDIASMSFNDLDSLIKAGTDRIVLNRTEAKKIRETLAPVIVRAYELLSKNQGARTDLDPSLPTVEKWMEQNKALGSPSTFYRILREAKAILPQVGDTVTTPDGQVAKISHLHSTAPDKVDAEIDLHDGSQPVPKTYNLKDLKPLNSRGTYCATTPHGWDVDVAISAAHKFMRWGDEGNATYFLKELYWTNEEGRCKINLWKHVLVYTCEDIGLADLTVKTKVLELYHEVKRHLAELEEIAEICEGDTRHSDLEMLVEAMLICCRAEKSRAVDDGIVWFKYKNPTYKAPTPEEIELAVKTNQPKPVIPDDSPIYDKHTKKGRAMGRKGKAGIDHFLKEGAKLENKSKDVPDFQPPVVHPEKPFLTEGGL
jgi:hypothetical protein